MFQFHEGPIKTGLRRTGLGCYVWFQFHEGPIKTIANNGRPTMSNSFNSMKVRLKQGGGKFDFEVREQFQFHEGPIKTSLILS